MNPEGDIERSRDPSASASLTRYAFANPYNLSLLAGALCASAASGEGWIAACAGAAEAAWLLLAPESPWLCRVVLEPMRADAARARFEARVAQGLSALSPEGQVRARALIEQRARLDELARDNPSLATVLVQAELDKLDELVLDFVDQAKVAERTERHLAGVDRRAMEAAWSVHEAEVRGLREGDPRREVAAKNLAVLRQRADRHADLARALGTARGQMELIENTLRLLADEIITMAGPAELGQRIEGLRVAVGAIREAVLEACDEPVSRRASPPEVG